MRESRGDGKATTAQAHLSHGHPQERKRGERERMDKTQRHRKDGRGSPGQAEGLRWLLLAFYHEAMLCVFGFCEVPHVMG